MMNPNTGEIIAMADYPTFDSNDPRNLSSYDQTADMSDDDKMDHTYEGIHHSHGIPKYTKHRKNRHETF